MSKPETLPPLGAYDRRDAYGIYSPLSKDGLLWDDPNIKPYRQKQFIPLGAVLKTIDSDVLLPDIPEYDTKGPLAKICARPPEIPQELPFIPLTEDGLFQDRAPGVLPDLPQIETGVPIEICTAGALALAGAQAS